MAPPTSTESGGAIIGQVAHTDVGVGFDLVVAGVLDEGGEEVAGVGDLACQLHLAAAAFFRRLSADPIERIAVVDHAEQDAAVAEAEAQLASARDDADRLMVDCPRSPAGFISTAATPALQPVGEVLLVQGEGARQSHVAELGAGVGERHSPKDGVGSTDRHHVDVLAVPQFLLRDPHHPVLVRNKVRQQDARLHEEVEVRRIGDRAGTAPAGRTFRFRGSGLAAGAIGVFAAGYGLLFAGVGFADGPGIQQQTRALEHVAREARRVAPLEDVAVLVADLAALVGRFRDTRVWVAGDIMLDEYLIGDIGRISPEAPVPVLEYRQEEAIYDRLAVSVTGETLTEVYLEQRRALEMEERGGARARVETVEVPEVRQVSAADKGGFVADAVWVVGGTVTHFGHRHFRQNRYDAIGLQECIAAAAEGIGYGDDLPDDEAIGIAIALIILIVVFGTVVAAVVPIILAIVAIIVVLAKDPLSVAAWIVAALAVMGIFLGFFASKASTSE